MRQIRKEMAIWCAVGLVAGVGVSTYLVEHPESIGLLSIAQILESTVTLVSIALWAFLLFAWRWKIFAGWLVLIPDLAGTWRGSITPITVQDGEESHGPKIAATLVIRQSLFSINAVLHTQAMQSHSFSGEVFLDEAIGQIRLVYNYSTDPNLGERQSNPRHDGSTLLIARQDRGRPRSLEGKYWTDRLTRGEVLLNFVDRRRNEHVSD